MRNPMRQMMLLDSMRKMAPGTMGGESRVATPPGPNWGVDVRGGVSELCPTPIAIDGNQAMFMGLTVGDFFISSGDWVYRYSFPDITYVEDVYDVGSFSYPPPFDNGPFIQSIGQGLGDVCVGPDGFFYHMIYPSGGLGYLGIAKVAPDGSSAAILTSWGPDYLGSVYAQIAWHTSDPGNLWVHWKTLDPGGPNPYVEGLWSVSLATGAPTLRLDMAANSMTSNFWSYNMMQYSSGIVIDLQDGFLVYDISSQTYDSIAVTRRGYYTVFSRNKIRYHPTIGSDSIGQIAITGSVALTEETPDCDTLRGYFEIPINPEDYYFADAQNWMSPIDRSQFFFDDGYHIWEIG